MLDDFAETTRGVLEDARAEGERHGWLGTEHLLLGVLQNPDTPAAAVLAELGVTPDDVRSEVDRLNATNAGGLSPGPAPLTPHANHALAIARERADPDDVAPEHVLLGVLDVGSLALLLLQRRGVNIATLRQRL